MSSVTFLYADSLVGIYLGSIPESAQCYKHLFTIKSKFIMSYLSQFIVRDKKGNETRIIRKDPRFSTLIKRLERFLADGCEIENLRTKIRCAQ